MNLPVIFSKIGSAVKNAAGGTVLFTKAHAPEILVGGGVAGFVLTVIGACKATSKAVDIIEEKESALLENDTYLAEGVLTQKEHDDNIRITNRNARWMLVKTYLPTATGLAVSVILVLGGYRMINGRLVKTAAAYKLLEDGFGRYRENVRDEFGEETDWRMLNNVRPERLQAANAEREANREIEADKKRKRKNYENRRTGYQEIYSQIFDQYSDRWRRSWTPDQVWEYLRQKQREANDMLRIRKHLFLNEVYDLLGMERTEPGCVVGWILTKNNPDSYVDFGLDSIPEERRREILSAERNEDIWVRLHFNPDGLIYNMIDKASK